MLSTPSQATNPLNSQANQTSIARLAASPAGFGVLTSHGKYELPAHVQYINRVLLDLAARRIKRLMIFTPPRHGKSHLLSQLFPAWYLGTHPDHRVILTAYEAGFAATWGRKARDLLTEWGELLYNVQMSDSSSAANRWDLHGRAGGMITAGVGGPITGRGADLLLLDDPVKNAEQAMSETYRQHVKDWWLSTAYTRLEPNACAVITMTRWHEDDLAGWLLGDGASETDEPWTVISLPALAEEDDLLGRQPGEALWPERYHVERLHQIRATLDNSYWWQALYQQRPTPVSGSTFLRDWFGKRYHQIPTNLIGVVLAVDSAFKEGSNADYSAFAVWGTDGYNYYLLYAWRGKVNFPTLLYKIQDTYYSYRPDVILIEDAASGQSAIQQLRHDTNLPVLGVPALGSKVSRAEGVSPLFESGKAYLPDAELLPMLSEWIDEHVYFPRGKHDDMVDTTSHALAYLKKHYSASGGVTFASTRHSLSPLDAWTIEQEEMRVAAEHEADLQARYPLARPLPQFDPTLVEVPTMVEEPYPEAHAPRKVKKPPAEMTPDEVQAEHVRLQQEHIFSLLSQLGVTDPFSSR